MTSLSPDEGRIGGTASRGTVRQALLGAAERLFALRGIEGVSLRQIVSAAGQRNPAAVQYHFGDKEGLIRAILEERVPCFNRRRVELLDELELEGRLRDLRGIVGAIVIPLLELEPPNGYYVRFLARLAQDRELSRRVFESLDEATGGGGRRLAEVLDSALTDLPPDLRAERSAMTIALVSSALARREAQSDAGNPVAPQDVFVDDLIDASVGLLTAPVSRTKGRQVGRRGGRRG